MEHKEITKRIQSLLVNEDFKKVFIDEYINNRTKQLVLNEDIKNEEVQNKLKAIKEFKDFIEYYVTVAKI